MSTLAPATARRGRKITQAVAGHTLIVGGVLVFLGPYLASLEPLDELWVPFIASPLLVPLGLAIMAGLSVRRDALRGALTASALGMIAIALVSLMFAILASFDARIALADLVARIAPAVISLGLVVLTATLRPRTGRGALRVLMLTAAVLGIAAAVIFNTPAAIVWAFVLDLSFVVFGFAALPQSRWEGRWLVGALWPLDNPPTS